MAREWLALSLLRAMTREWLARLLVIFMAFSLLVWFGLGHPAGRRANWLQAVVGRVPVCAGPRHRGHPTFCGYPGRRDRGILERGDVT